MASNKEANEIVPNNRARAPIWKHFGFPKRNNNVDQSCVICKVCAQTLRYSGNTTNLSDHMKRKHPALLDSRAPSSISQSQDLVKYKQPSIFSTKLSGESQRSTQITSAILQFIVKDLRPFSVVSNEGFKNMISTLEPRYTIPGRQHFSESAMPKLYEKVKQDVIEDLQKAVTVSLTTDSWTSRATESYVTITSVHIDEEWNMKNYVLQVREFTQSSSYSLFKNLEKHYV